MNEITLLEKSIHSFNMWSDRISYQIQLLSGPDININIMNKILILFLTLSTSIIVSQELYQDDLQNYTFSVRMNQKIMATYFPPNEILDI